VHQVSRKTIKIELCQNNFWNFLHKYLPGNQHRVLAVKMYIDISGIVNPTLFLLACF